MTTELQDLLETLVAIDSQNPGVGEAEMARYVVEFARHRTGTKQRADHR
jgi:hypothetical protein